MNKILSNQLNVIKLVLIMSISYAVIALVLGLIKDITIGLSFLSGGIIYAVAILVYGLMYFSRRGAISSQQVLVSLAWGILMKYLIIIVCCSLLLIYTPVNSGAFFSALAIAHLAYIGVISLYNRWN